MISTAPDHAGFIRRIEFTAGFDRRHEDPKKDYGIHGAELRFVLIGPKGATHLVLFTNWMTKTVRVERDDGSPCRPRWLHEPIAADLGYHSPEPLYEGQTAARPTCEYLGGKPCYCDGSSVRATSGFDALTDGGDEAVWVLLHDEYALRFEGADSAESPIERAGFGEVMSAFIDAVRPEEKTP